MFEDRLSLRLSYDRRERGPVRLLHGLQAAEMFEEAAGGGFANAGNFAKLGGAVADLTALAMKSEGKAVRFVADHLYQV